MKEKTICAAKIFAGSDYLIPRGFPKKGLQTKCNWSVSTWIKTPSKELNAEKDLSPTLSSRLSRKYSTSPLTRLFKTAEGLLQKIKPTEGHADCRKSLVEKSKIKICTKLLGSLREEAPDEVGWGRARYDRISTNSKLRGLLPSRYRVPPSRCGSVMLGLWHHTVVSFTTLASLRYLSEEGNAAPPINKNLTPYFNVQNKNRRLGRFS